MSTNRLYRAVKEQGAAQEAFNIASRRAWGPDKVLSHADPLVLRLRECNVELELAMIEAKGIIEAPTESARRVAMRCAGERDIARHLLRSLVEQGFVLQDSEDEDEEWTNDPDKMLSVVMDVDAIYVNVKHTQPKEGWDDSGWVFLVRGNSPEEMISDHTTNLEQYLKPTFRYIKSFYDPSYIIEGESA